MNPCDEFWIPTASAIQAVIDCLPIETQKKVIERLRLLAKVQADKGLIMASNFSRAVSGEELPQPKPKPRLKVVK